MKTFVGLDYHKSYSFATVIDQAGQVLRRGRVDNDAGALRRFLGEAGAGGPDCCAVLEATRNWCLMHDTLETLVGRVTLAHPLKVRQIAEARVKTDKIDSLTLAHLLRCDLIPAAHVCSRETRGLKNLLRHRMFLVRVQTMCKNRIHVLLDRHPPLRSQREADELFTVSGITWLGSLPLADQTERKILEGEVRLLVAVRERIAQADAHLKDAGQDDPRVKRLRTVPGIGPFLSRLVAAEIDDVARFASDRKLHAYAGLVPSTYSSGGRTFHGQITRLGNPYLRWAMIEAVTPACVKDPQLRRLHERVEQTRGANKARVVVARRLLTIVYRVLKQNRPWQRRDDAGGDASEATTGVKAMKPGVKTMKPGVKTMKPGVKR